MTGAWGKATADSLDGGLVQLRALDWTTNGMPRCFEPANVPLCRYALCLLLQVLSRSSRCLSHGIRQAETVTLSVHWAGLECLVLLLELVQLVLASQKKSGMPTRAIRPFLAMRGLFSCKTCFRCHYPHTHAPTPPNLHRSHFHSFTLQFDLDTDQALSRIATANRTCRWASCSTSCCCCAENSVAYCGVLVQHLDGYWRR